MSDKIKICNAEGCSELRATAGFQSNGNQIYRNKCLPHYQQELSSKKGFKTYEEYVIHKNNELALSNGFESYAEYKNFTHPYRKYRLTYCENKDGRLNFKCTTTIKVIAQLEVDHIDGNPSNNEPENLQTLCSCCHKYKSILYEDHKTPGRKELGIKY